MLWVVMDETGKPDLSRHLLPGEDDLFLMAAVMFRQEDETPLRERVAAFRRQRVTAGRKLQELKATRLSSDERAAFWRHVSNLQLRIHAAVVRRSAVTPKQVREWKRQLRLPCVVASAEQAARVATPLRIVVDEYGSKATDRDLYKAARQRLNETVGPGALKELSSEASDKSELIQTADLACRLARERLRPGGENPAGPEVHFTWLTSEGQEKPLD